MDLNLFQYDYPQALVAQHPLPERDSSRMMVLSRHAQTSEHRRFSELTDYLRPGDLLVLNDSKVIPARLLGKNDAGHAIEILLLRPESPAVWQCLAKPWKRAAVGAQIFFGEKFSGKIISNNGEQISIELVAENLAESLEAFGLPPLPPYIKRKSLEDYSAQDRERYQTIFAKQLGSAAAPTAGLHFSTPMLEKLRVQGVEIGFVTLHVSIDTFLPIRVEDITQHKMHGEYFVVPPKTAEAVRRTKAEGGRVIAVGTTAVRALESDWTQPTTHHYIYPGVAFKIVDGILTNFHQPGSTLIAMISAFVGRERLLQAYQEAITQKYRLFSFGDCMLLL